MINGFHRRARYNSLKSFPSRYFNFLCLIDATEGELFNNVLAFDFLIKLQKRNSSE